MWWEKYGGQQTNDDFLMMIAFEYSNFLIFSFITQERLDAFGWSLSPFQNRKNGIRKYFTLSHFEKLLECPMDQSDDEKISV